MKYRMMKYGVVTRMLYGISIMPGRTRTHTLRHSATNTRALTDEDTGVSATALRHTRRTDGEGLHPPGVRRTRLLAVVHGSHRECRADGRVDTQRGGEQQRQQDERELRLDAADVVRLQLQHTQRIIVAAKEGTQRWPWLGYSSMEVEV
jgi:hypothetical protein